MPKLRAKIEIQDGGRPPSWIFENLIFELWGPWAADFPSRCKIWCKNVDRSRNYSLKSKSKMAAVRHLGFSNIRFLSMATLWAADIPSWYQIWSKNVSTPKLWPKIEIRDGGRPPSWIFENLIFELWGPLGCRCSISV